MRESKMSLEKFHEWLKLNKNSKETVKGYFRKVDHFFKLYDEFNQENVNNFFIQLVEEKRTRNTFNSYLNALKTYNEYSNSEIKFPKYKKQKKGNIKFYFKEKDLDNISKILPLITKHYNEAEILFRFMFYTGVRPSKALDINVSDIDFKQKLVNVYNAKGEKDRTIYFITKDFFKKLEEYCRHREGKLFDMSITKFRRILHKVEEELNIQNPITPKTFRISFAKHCVLKKMNILVIQKLLGHNDIKTTEIYAEPDEEIIKQTCEEFRKGDLR